MNARAKFKNKIDMLRTKKEKLLLILLLCLLNLGGFVGGHNYLWSPENLCDDTHYLGQILDADLNYVPACFDCPYGTYRPDPNADSCDETCDGLRYANYESGHCEYKCGEGGCSAGSFCEGILVLYGYPFPISYYTYSCETCPPGNYCQGGLHPPAPCEAGTYQSQTGMSFCNECSPGYYEESSGQTACEEKCPQNTYQSQAGATACVSCGVGEITLQEGSQSSGDCFCADGEADLESSQECRSCDKCAPGTYKLGTCFDDAGTNADCSASGCLFSSIDKPLDCLSQVANCTRSVLFPNYFVITL